MVSEKNGRRYTPRFKFQVVMEILSGTKAIGQIARSYGVHPVTLTHWKKEFIEKGPEIFSQQTTIQEYEKRIEDLERLIGHKEVEIALLKNFMAGSLPRAKKLSWRVSLRSNMGSTGSWPPWVFPKARGTTPNGNEAMKRSIPA